MGGVVGLVVAVAVAVYAVTDSTVVANICYLGVLVGAAVGAWVGAERTPRGHRLVPRLIAVGVSLTALGDVLWSVLDAVGADTDVSIADPPWLASYVVLCVAVWLIFDRSQGRAGPHVDQDFLLDAVTIVVVSVLIFWSTSIGAIVGDQSASLSMRAVSAAYPILDAILLALVLRILMNRASRGAIGVSFAVGVLLWLAADIGYLYAPDAGARAMLLMDAAWMIAPVLVAAAAWRTHDESADAPGPLTAGGWILPMTVAVAPLLVPPALELATDLRGLPDQPVQLFVGTAVLIGLTFVRTARLIRSETRTRRELEVARDAALEASRAKSTFLANVSHEVRTPLTTVLATAEMLEDTPLDDLQARLVTKMQRSGVLLKSLVEGVLDFSRIEAGELEVASTAFDLHAIVAEVAEIYLPRASAAGVRFECHLDPGTPRTVIGDPGRLFQVLSNLLDNALKFTHEGQVTLTVRPTPTGDEEDPRACVEFLVADTGIGIREEDQEAIFESFKQVDGSMTRTYGGSGLGLAISQELTQLMGGSLGVQSRLGAGSTFTVRIAMAVVD